MTIDADLTIITRKPGGKWKVAGTQRVWFTQSCVKDFTQTNVNELRFPVKRGHTDFAGIVTSRTHKPIGINVDVFPACGFESQLVIAPGRLEVGG